jgi:uncharacterized protein YndB with AHSA1/START domain
MSRSFEPVRKEARVRLDVGEAFRLFTEEMAAWWPLETHSVAGERARTVIFEPRRDGRIFEVDIDGAESRWGTVLAYDPPTRVVFSWHPGRAAETAGTVEVTFRQAGNGTVVNLTHTGWEKLGEAGEATRAGYDTGWDLVFGDRYVAAAGRATPSAD